MVLGTPFKRLGARFGWCGFPRVRDRRARRRKSLAKADFPPTHEMVNFENPAVAASRQNGQGMPPHRKPSSGCGPIGPRETPVFASFAKS
jgi:hypothetical protein